MRVGRLDHVVLTVRDLDVTVAFYQVLGMRRVEFAGGTRVALAFGEQKLNLHQQGNEFLPNAREARPGSADLCLLVETPLGEVLAHLKRENVAIEYGPDDADGATGPLRSVWIRDPDGNLVELAEKK
jgi:catechol 2,3-dioxygenase-like lactoylglutathione lyase family enzyme